MHRATRLSLWIFVGLLAYAPLHILLSTWFGSAFGVLPLAKVAKDIVMVWGAGIALGAYLTKYGTRTAYKDRLLQLIALYALLTVILALARPTDQEAEIVGIVFNLRFLVFFVYGLLLTKLVDIRGLRQKSLVAVLASALIVLVFGVLQYTTLPNNALTHAGYSRQNGVLPAFFIDDKPDLERIMSTQRDPNSFGSYVLIIIGLAGALWARGKRFRSLSRGFLLLSALCLWFSFSRSAWIGGLLTAVVLVLLQPNHRARLKAHKKQLLGAGIVVMIVAITGLVAARNTYLVQNVILHADSSTVLEDPNQLRLRFFRESVEEIGGNPLGSGPGTAGLASIRNTIQGVQLNENYYLQIAAEIGVVGLVLFLSILGMLAWRLWQRATSDWLAIGLLASMIGLLFTNALVHIWSTEAVAYTWWGLAALAMPGSWHVAPKPAILKRTKK